MNKTYWWRILLVLIASVGIVAAYVGPCTYNLSRCLGGDSIPVARSIFHFSVAIFLMSLLLIFVADQVFTKWLRFAIVWFILASILIYIAPTINRGMDFVPTKELTSIWMGVLFVVISIGKIIWDSKRLKA